MYSNTRWGRVFAYYHKHGVEIFCIEGLEHVYKELGIPVKRENTLRVFLSVNAKRGKLKKLGHNMYTWP